MIGLSITTATGGEGTSETSGKGGGAVVSARQPRYLSRSNQLLGIQSLAFQLRSVVNRSCSQ